MKPAAVLLLLCAGVLFAVAMPPARAHDVFLHEVGPLPPSEEPAPAATDLDKFCDSGCRKVVTGEGVAKVGCWMCCYETCRCKADAKYCVDARENCMPEFTASCPDIAKRAPTPTK